MEVQKWCFVAIRRPDSFPFKILKREKALKTLLPTETLLPAADRFLEFCQGPCVTVVYLAWGHMSLPRCYLPATSLDPAARPTALPPQENDRSQAESWLPWASKSTAWNSHLSDSDRCEFRLRFLGSLFSVGYAIFVYTKHRHGRGGQGRAAFQRKKGVHMVSRENGRRYPVWKGVQLALRHVHARGFFRDSLAKAVALPAVELCQSLWQLTTQTLYIIIVVDVHGTCLKPCAVLIDRLLPSSLWCGFD